MVLLNLYCVDLKNSTVDFLLEKKQRINENIKFLRKIKSEKNELRLKYYEPNNIQNVFSDIDCSIDNKIDKKIDELLEVIDTLGNLQEKEDVENNVSILLKHNIIN